MMASRLKGTLNDFLLGLRGQFPTLEEALMHPDSERKLINLHDPTTSYNPRQHAVYYLKDGKQHRLPLDPAFRDYMRDYADSTHYVTDKGTPWLTRKQEYRNSISQQQQDDYYFALTRGENREAVILNWLNTQKMETGHAALSVGSLDLADGSAETDEIPLYEYTPEITGSYYGSTTPLLGKKHFSEYRDGSRVRKVSDDNPVAHAVGTTLRDGAAPLGSIVGGGLLAVAALLHKSKKSGASERKQREILKKGLFSVGTMTAASMAAVSSGLLVSSNGTLLMKEEMESTGMLATLITPAQRDIMEHSLYGVYQTYHEKYNILNNNCADFATKMLQDISIDLDAAVRRAMEQEPPRSLSQRATQPIPQHIQPGRAGWALRNRTSATGIVTLEPSPDGEDKKFSQMRRSKGHVERLRRARMAETGDEVLHVSPIETLGQSSVLVETASYDRQFRQPPIETFRDVMKQALTLKKDPQGSYHFALQPHVPLLEKGRDAAPSR